MTTSTDLKAQAARVAAMRFVSHHLPDLRYFAARYLECGGTILDSLAEPNGTLVMLANAGVDVDGMVAEFNRLVEPV